MLKHLKASVTTELMFIDFGRLGLQTTLNKVDINFLYNDRLLNEIWRDLFCRAPAGDLLKRHQMNF